MENVFVGARGYLALKKQTDKDTAVTPTVFVPYYEESLQTMNEKHRQGSVKGNRNAAQDTHQGLRSHGGDIKILAEPNTAAHIFNMLMTAGAPSGAGPYTYAYTVGDSEVYYTADVKKGKYVERFIGVKANSVKPAYEENIAQFEVSLSALASFKVATVASVTGSGPYTITLNTDYDPTPTKGLVVGDIIEVGGINAIVDSVASATTITVSEDVSALSGGEQLFLRAQTPSYSLLTPFSWARTEYRFGADASAALSATHTPLDDGTEWELTHANEADEGAHTTGSYDPSDLRRTIFDGTVTAVRVFNSLTQTEDFLDNNKQALVVRMFAGNTSTYELRLTFNHLKSIEQTKETAFDSVTKTTDTLAPQVDASDGVAVGVTIINNLSTL